MKKQLIKEIDCYGKTWFWTEMDGNKVTPFETSLEIAIEDFNNYMKTKPIKEVIKEEEINSQNL